MDKPSNKVESLIKRETERQQDLQKKKNERKRINPENEQYSYFNNIFETKCKEIELILDMAPALDKNDMVIQFDKASKELNSVKKFMADSLIFLRGYDIRICNGQIQDLELKIKKTEDTLLPKKKFGFKNKKAPKETLNDETSNGSDVVDSVISHKKINFVENFFGFKDCVGQTLILENNNLFKKDVTLANLTDCTIILPGTPSTLQMSNLKNCVLLCGPVCTSIFADNCLDCTLVIACQQLRLHSSKNCQIYLHVTCRAIIEDCNAIKVAPYNYSYSDITVDFMKASLDFDVNHWDSLDDFNWLVADKHSPNWSVLDEALRISDWDNYLNENVQNGK